MGLNIINANVNGLKTHIDTIIDCILNNKPDTVHLQETKLGPNDLFKLNIQNYTVMKNLEM